MFPTTLRVKLNDDSLMTKLRCSISLYNAHSSLSRLSTCLNTCLVQKKNSPPPPICNRLHSLDFVCTSRTVSLYRSTLIIYTHTSYVKLLRKMISIITKETRASRKRLKFQVIISQIKSHFYQDISLPICQYYVRRTASHTVTYKTRYYSPIGKNVKCSNFVRNPSKCR
jgi:hypothetical protein